MSPRSVTRALVVGGGIGGLALGACLAKRGVAVDLVEARTEASFAAHGVGLGQSANALRALARVGVLEDCLHAGFWFDHIAFFDNEERFIAKHVFRLGGGELPAWCALSRADLHRFLMGACKESGVQLTFGDSVAALEQSLRDVRVQFRNGGSGTYDVVAGFDGVRSRIRELLYAGKFRPRYLGYGVWRVAARRLSEVDGMKSYHAADSKTALLPIGPDRMYLAHIRAEPEHARYPHDELRGELVRRLDGYHGRLRDVLDGLPVEAQIVYSPLEALFVSEPWYVGRVVIGGDAAHAFPPHLTQGAGMALEDAVILADELASRDDVPEALASFLERRYRRTRFVHDTSVSILRREQTIPRGSPPGTGITEMVLDNIRRLEMADVELDRRVL